jgi:hypothetical protein
MSESNLDTDRLTWALLLARWVEFARSALALPKDATGKRMKDSVGDVINLQAVFFALEDIDDLGADERALGIDRAALLIEKHTGALESRWQNELPHQLRELINDAQERLKSRQAD